MKDAVRSLFDQARVLTAQYVTAHSGWMQLDGDNLTMDDLARYQLATRLCGEIDTLAKRYGWVEKQPVHGLLYYRLDLSVLSRTELRAMLGHAYDAGHRDARLAAEKKGN